MSQKYLKTDTLDIHAGGRDLIFPHHENELTQAQALTGKPFAKYWIHHGLLTINSQKMSKSLGNFVTIKDFTAKYNNADLLKLFFLSAHYSHPVDYTDEKIGEAKQALERIMILLDKMEKMSFPPKLKNPPFPELEEIKSKFIKAMDDDFNTPQALASVFELVNLANKNIDDLDFSSGAYKLFFELAGIFGLEFKKAAAGQSLDSEIEALIDKRDGARKRKDFAESDRLRKELEARGIILEDTKDGTAWRRKL